MLAILKFHRLLRIRVGRFYLADEGSASKPMFHIFNPLDVIGIDLCPVFTIYQGYASL